MYLYIVILCVKIKTDNFEELTKKVKQQIERHYVQEQIKGLSYRKKVDEYNYRKATSDMSVFYGSESDSDVSEYSILSYRYKNFNK